MGSTYNARQVKLPTDKPEERKLLTTEHIEEGKKTTKSETRALLGTRRPKSKK